MYRHAGTFVGRWYFVRNARAVSRGEARDGDVVLDADGHAVEGAEGPFAMPSCLGRPCHVECILGYPAERIHDGVELLNASEYGFHDVDRRGTSRFKERVQFPYSQIAELTAHIISLLIIIK